MVSGMVFGGASELPEGHFGASRGIIFGPLWGSQGIGSGLRTDFAVIFAQGSASLRFGTASVVIFASKKMFEVRFRSIWEKRFRVKYVPVRSGSTMRRKAFFPV